MQFIFKDTAEQKYILIVTLNSHYLNIILLYIACWVTLYDFFSCFFLNEAGNIINFFGLKRNAFNAACCIELVKNKSSFQIDFHLVSSKMIKEVFERSEWNDCTESNILLRFSYTAIKLYKARCRFSAVAVWDKVKWNK